jgi:hypothetical protein
VIKKPFKGVGGLWGKVAQTKYTHGNKSKNDKIKGEQKNPININSGKHFHTSEPLIWVHFKVIPSMRIF